MIKYIAIPETNSRLCFRHLSFDEDLTFDVAVEAEPDFIVPVMDEEDTISDIPLPHDQPQRGGQHPFEEISFTNQHRRGGRGNKMVDTSVSTSSSVLFSCFQGVSWFASIYCLIHRAVVCVATISCTDSVICE